MTKTKTAEVEEGAMGFKDKKKALDTLQVLKERDISYQFHVITSFVSRVKRTLQITKDEEKLSNLGEALKVFEDWLSDYKQNNRGKENLAYLPLEIVKSYRPLAKKYEILNDDFFTAYKKEKGDYKALRSVKVENGKTTWDIERNRRLKEIVNKIKEEHIQWYETDVGDLRGLPTKEHTKCIILGYSPDPTKLRKLVSQVKEKFGDDEEDNAAEMEIDDERNIKPAKRSHESSSSDDSDNCEPDKKILKQAKNAGETGDKEESGLSFKDKNRALRSIKSLEGRDVSYQYHAIAGLIKRAERVISITKDEEKIRNMKEAVEVLENWVTDYNLNGRSQENFNYLSIDIVRSFKPLAEKYNIEDNGFFKAYEEANGDYKKLRTAQVPEKEITWDVHRNRNLRILVDKIKESHVEWFETDAAEFCGLPTKEHTQCIMWAFSHDAAKLKKLSPTLKDKLNTNE